MLSTAHVLQQGRQTNSKGTVLFADSGVIRYGCLVCHDSFGFSCTLSKHFLPSPSLEVSAHNPVLLEEIKLLLSLCPSSSL